MVSPTLAKPSGPVFTVPTFVIVMEGSAASAVLVGPVAETSGPDGGLPVTLATLSTLPASMSIAVKT